EISQQVAVVGAHLDDETPLAEAQPPRDHLDVIRRVTEPALGNRGEVSVVTAEQIARLRMVFRLHEPAARAHPELERKVVRGFPEVGRVYESVRRRRKTEVEKHVLQRRLAVTAVHTGMPAKSGPRPGSDRSRSDKSHGDSGQRMPRRASSKRTPPSASGA